ncbi:VCBS repeat-containing protein [Dyadobacter chenwenxiniae]|uniref:VCBS repeat-containing protein n=1 Tax=Dyadobacter chenwenxiniae TaxID=2906456 RepID=A0A9X1TKP7_9BACT|nr:VCBS repeat-containing protein [Dyadobacter chenwenxiniae]MCF0061423.1 VCBS repeat-containing protein [Dyadobacter chenwenxiniae]UON81245.1 VCBS repeat-containing protein [Dyadobacter chenwenxiniae]
MRTIAIQLKWLCLIQVFLLSGFASQAQTKQNKNRTVSFKKQVLIKKFISEGAAMGDVNKDGKKDILAGAFWFEAPSWKAHELAKPDSFIVNGGYSDSFLDFAMDVNQDGWIDLIRIDWPGKASVWHENPKGKAGYWPTHVIHSSVGNESPMLVDIDGDGRLDLLGNDPTAKKVIWLQAPVKKGETKWEKFTISNDETIATHMYTHGIGYGDINGDGRKDVLVKNGWWEGPAEGPAKVAKDGDWKFHPADLGKDCSQMYVMDLNGDGLNDVLTASAHDYGIWWHEQGKDDKGESTWRHHSIDNTFSQTHGLALADINGDGNIDFVTGKRYFAHHGNDPGEFEPAVIYWFEYKPGKVPSWTRHEIDNDSGVGLHVTIEDLNKDGLLDIVTGNKKGVRIFTQSR